MTPQEIMRGCKKENILEFDKDSNFTNLCIKVRDRIKEKNGFEPKSLNKILGYATDDERRELRQAFLDELEKDGNNRTEAEKLFDNLKHKSKGMETISLTRDGFKEICEHIVEWHSNNTKTNMDTRDGIVPIRQEKESRFVYIPGTEPMFHEGETIACYECSTDCEGEIYIGTITKVEYDSYMSDWMYTFEDGTSQCEESLLAYEAYQIKNKK